MADAREHGPTGHAPIDPARGINGAGVGDSQPVKVDMGMGPPAARSQPEPPPARGVGASVLVPSLLSLIFGGLGAWAYEHFLATPAPGASIAKPQESDGQTQPQIAELEGRIQDLSDRYRALSDQNKKLQTRLESVTSPAPAADLSPIERKVARVDQLAEQVDALGKKLDPLPQKLEDDERRIAELGENIDGLQNRMAIGRVAAPGGRDRPINLARGDRPMPAGPSDDRFNRPDLATDDRPSASSPESAGSADDVGSAEPSLQSGEELFRKGQYSAAYADFRRILQTQPDDARVWYYAALSYGLATGEWDGMTRTMAEEGAAREKAGKPGKSQVDAALKGLTKETGKDWLAFFRRQAG